MSFDTQPAASESHLRLHGLTTTQCGDADENDIETSSPWVEAPAGVYAFPAPRGKSAILRRLTDERLTAKEVNSSPALIAGTAPADVGQSQRVLLTLLFTDIVGSTQTAERLGDHAWCLLLFRHHSIVRAHLKAYNGREIDTAGDGFFLTFDRPGLAIRFATAVRAALKDIGIDIRAGIHAGECELIDGRVEGVAVHTAARVAHVADDGEILVSNTVRDLLAGSGLRFSGRDAQILKGLSEPRRLFALEL